MTLTDSYIDNRKSARLLKVPNHPKRPPIEKGIPVPSEARGGTRKFDHFYPFEDMLPGDSFWVPSNTQCTAGAITKFSRKTGWKFISRGQTIDGQSNKTALKSKRGTRVWRIS